MACDRTLTVAQTAEMACAMEVLCPKPGNVGPGRPFKYLNEMSFIASAMGLADAFGDPDASVGALALRAASATKKLVDRNTNLGIILLLAPLVKAAHEDRRKEHCCPPRPRGLRGSVGRVLLGLGEEDSEAIFEAIRLSSPEGLGQSDRYDVNGGIRGNAPVLEAMKHASAWDSVAREYATGYEITFGLTAPNIETFWNDGRSIKESIQQTFLLLLSEIPDTLIARKSGREASETASGMARRAAASGGFFTAPGRDAISALAEFLEDPDNLMNPGTTADLVAAGIFVFLDRVLGREPLPNLLDRWDWR
jgi:triphosphoribosyl-dephospho-CoA synthase